VIPEQRKVKRMCVEDYDEDGEKKTHHIFSIVVYNVTASDVGIYSCRASNPYGIARASCNVQFRAGAAREKDGSEERREGKEVQLEKEDFLGAPPKFTSFPDEVIFVSHGESLTIRCKLVGSPQPTSKLFQTFQYIYLFLMDQIK
jgi:hypothetical protein